MSAPEEVPDHWVNNHQKVSEPPDKLGRRALQSSRCSSCLTAEMSYPETQSKLQIHEQDNGLVIRFQTYWTPRKVKPTPMKYCLKTVDNDQNLEQFICPLTEKQINSYVL